MLRYIVRRLAIAVPTLVGVTLLTFLLLHLVPGDPVGAAAAENPGGLNPIALERMRAVYHLDEPIPVQYGLWLSGILRGDLGVSLADGQPVAAKIAERLPATLLLGFAALSLAWGIGLPLGIALALRRGRRVEGASDLVLSALFSVPVFWTGLILQGLFAVHLQWLPLQGLHADGSGGWGAARQGIDLLRHLALPALCLASVQIVFLSRFVRGGMIEALSQDYIRTARAKGHTAQSAARRHALRNVAVPLASLLGLMLPAVAGGAVIVERVFSWPGAGRLFLESIQNRDLTTLMGLTLLGSVLTVLGSLLSDLLIAWADPRVRLGGRASE
jgi:peptide/nickel transport system permease protein